MDRGEGKIEVQLIGPPSVRLDGKKVKFPYQKVEGLFYYICVNKEITRSQAMGVLWADCSEDAARKNLRDAIYNIKKILGPDILNVEGNTRIILNRERNIQIDIEQIKKETILENWKGEFLQLFFVKNCYEFEEWVQKEREEQKRNYVKILQLRIMRQRTGQDLDFLEKSGHVLLQNEIMDEDLYRSIMKKLAEAGKYTEAIELYQNLKSFLEREVEAEPEEETRILFEEISDIKNRLKFSETEMGEYFFGRSDIILNIYSGICSKEGKIARNPCSFLITGEPGIGKTMLLRQIQKMLQESEYLIFTWNCFETEEELYLMPWYGIMAKVDEYCREKGLDVESPTDILVNSTSSDVQFCMTKFEILTESVFRYLTKYFQDKKIILFIDDMQWMDSMSIRLMSNLLFRMTQGNLIIIASCRDEDGEELRSFKIPLIGRGILKEITLKPFTFEETREIISEMGSKIEGNEILSKTLYEKTQGNPLFFMESLCLFEKGEEERFTERLSNVIQSRLLTLSKTERTMLDVLSIFSLPVTVHEINQIFDMQEMKLLDILEALSDKKLIYEKLDNGKIHFAFRHQIIREYVYSCIPTEKRKIYHIYIARFYEKVYEEDKKLDTCSLALYHYEQCGDIYKSYWYKVEYLEFFYKITYDLYPMLARKAVFSNNIDGYSAEKDELANLAEEIRTLQKKDEKMTPIRMRIEYLLGRYEMFVADCDRGKRFIEKSLELATELGDRDYMFYNYLQLILYGELTGKNGFMQETIEKCVIFMKDCTHHHLEEECMLLRYRGSCKMKNGEYQGAETLYREAIQRLDLQDKRNDKYQKELSACYHSMGMCYIQQEKWQEAGEYLEKAIESGRKYNISGETGVFYLDSSFILYHMKNYDMAEEHAIKAQKCFEQVGSLWGEAKVELCLALIYEARGLLEEGQEHRKNSEKLAKKLDSKFLKDELKRMEK